MSNFELIKTIGLAVIVLAIILYFLVLGIKNGWIKKLTETMNDAIKYAENQDPKWTATQKKQYVLEQLENKCYELGIPYALIKHLLDKLIDVVIAHYNVIAKGK